MTPTIDLLMAHRSIRKFTDEPVDEALLQTLVAAGQAAGFADIEKAFICDAVPCALMGMNSSTMCEYIEFVCDFWLVQLGYGKLYGTPNPFPFMESISLESKTNFFEKRVTSYSLAEKDHAFKCDDEDF